MALVKPQRALQAKFGASTMGYVIEVEQVDEWRPCNWVVRARSNNHEYRSRPMRHREAVELANYLLDIINQCELRSIASLHTENSDYAERLIEATNTILQKYRREKPDGWPVNWIWTECIYAERVTRHWKDGKQELWRVVIDNASPDASEFRDAILQALKDQGFSNLEVETIW